MKWKKLHEKINGILTQMMQLNVDTRNVNENQNEKLIELTNTINEAHYKL
jgi:hypothetical protein